MIILNIVSRGRPDLLAETARLTYSNISDHTTTQLMISLDEDDGPSLDNTEIDTYSDYINVCHREDTLGAKHNRALRAFPTANLFVPMVDYVPFVTPGFDQLLLSASEVFPDNFAVLHNDFANASFPYSLAVTGNLARHLGYIYPPYFPFWFIDHWLFELGERIGRLVYHPSESRVLPRLSPDGSPQMTQEYREVDFWSSLFDEGERHRRELALQLIDICYAGTPEWEMLRRAQPRIEHRSRWINQMVREQGRMMPRSTNFPPRYLRIREEAHRLFGEWK